MTRSILAMEIALPREIEELDDIAHQLLVAALPEGIVSVARFLLADGDERREEIDDAFQIPGAAAGPCPFVMQRIEAMAAFGVKDDEVLLASAGLRVSNPVLRFLGLGGEHQPARVRRAQQAVAQLLAAGATLAGAGRAGDQRPLHQIAQAQSGRSPRARVSSGRECDRGLP